MLRLSQGGGVGGALEDFAVEVDGGFESGGVIGAFSDAGIRRQIETTSLSQFLQLILEHFLFSFLFKYHKQSTNLHNI